MPKSVARTEPGRVANNREALSSATQLSNFGVRSAKITHRVSSDTAADLLSNIVLPAASSILGVSINVSEAYNGTAITLDVHAGGSTIITTPLSAASAGVVSAASADLVNESGELSLVFNAADSTEGEVTVVVAYLDLAEMK